MDYPQDGVMHILRGFPGSGKSTRVKELLKQMPNAYVASADNYFMRPDGTYAWYPQELGKAHAWCHQQAAYHAANGGFVIVDNCNVLASQVQLYVDIGKANNLLVVVETIKTNLTAAQLAARNVHKCPESSILKGMKNWEPYPGEHIYDNSVIDKPTSDNPNHWTYIEPGCRIPA